MTPSEIITKDSERLSYDPEIVLRKINKVVQSGAGVLIQANNSLLLAIAIEPNTAEIHLYTVDSPLNFKTSIKAFIKKLKKSGIKRIYSSFYAPKIIEMLDEEGLYIEKSDKSNYSWMATE